MLKCKNSRCYWGAVIKWRQTGSLWPAQATAPAHSRWFLYVSWVSSLFSAEFTFTPHSVKFCERSSFISARGLTFAEEEHLAFTKHEITADGMCLRYTSGLLCQGLNSPWPFFLCVNYLVQSWQQWVAQHPPRLSKPKTVSQSDNLLVRLLSVSRGFILSEGDLTFFLCLYLATWTYTQCALGRSELTHY